MREIIKKLIETLGPVANEKADDIVRECARELCLQAIKEKEVEEKELRLLLEKLKQ
jgi:hypothetical protein